MPRFEQISGIGYVNMDKVKKFYELGGGKIFIEYDDGSQETADSMNVQYQLDIMQGRSSIVQVIHSQKPIIAVYKDKGMDYYFEDVEFLGLCADGMLYGLTLNSEGWFEIIEECILHYKEEWTKERITLLKHKREEVLNSMEDEKHE